MSEPTTQAKLTPQFCFSTTALRGKLNLQLSRDTHMAQCLDHSTDPDDL